METMVDMELERSAVDGRAGADGDHGGHGEQGAGGRGGQDGRDGMDGYNMGRDDDEVATFFAKRRRLPRSVQVPGGEVGPAPSSPIVGILPPESQLTPGFPIRRRGAALPRAPQVPGGDASLAPATPPLGGVAMFSRYRPRPRR